MGSSSGRRCTGDGFDCDGEEEDYGNGPVPTFNEWRAERHYREEIRRLLQPTNESGVPAPMAMERMPTSSQPSPGRTSSLRNSDRLGAPTYKEFKAYRRYRAKCRRPFTLPLNSYPPTRNRQSNSNDQSPIGTPSHRSLTRTSTNRRSSISNNLSPIRTCRPTSRSPNSNTRYPARTSTPRLLPRSSQSRAQTSRASDRQVRDTPSTRCRPKCPKRRSPRERMATVRSLSIRVFPDLSPTGSMSSRDMPASGRVDLSRVSPNRTRRRRISPTRSRRRSISPTIETSCGCRRNRSSCDMCLIWPVIMKLMKKPDRLSTRTNSHGRSPASTFDRNRLTNRSSRRRRFTSRSSVSLISYREPTMSPKTDTLPMKSSHKSKPIITTSSTDNLPGRLSSSTILPTASFFSSTLPTVASRSCRRSPCNASPSNSFSNGTSAAEHFQPLLSQHTRSSHLTRSRRRQPTRLSTPTTSSSQLSDNSESSLTNRISFEDEFRWMANSSPDNIFTVRSDSPSQNFANSLYIDAVSNFSDYIENISSLPQPTRNSVYSNALKEFSAFISDLLSHVDSPTQGEDINDVAAGDRHHLNPPVGLLRHRETETRSERQKRLCRAFAATYRPSSPRRTSPRPTSPDFSSALDGPFLLREIQLRQQMEGAFSSMKEDIRVNRSYINANGRYAVDPARQLNAHNMHGDGATIDRSEVHLTPHVCRRESTRSPVRPTSHGAVSRNPLPRYSTPPRKYSPTRLLRLNIAQIRLHSSLLDLELDELKELRRLAGLSTTSPLDDNYASVPPPSTTFPFTNNDSSVLPSSTMYQLDNSYSSVPLPSTEYSLYNNDFISIPPLCTEYSLDNNDFISIPPPSTAYPLDNNDLLSDSLPSTTYPLYTSDSFRAPQPSITADHLNNNDFLRVPEPSAADRFDNSDSLNDSLPSGSTTFPLDNIDSLSGSPPNAVFSLDNSDTLSIPPTSTTLPLGSNDSVSSSLSSTTFPFNGDDPLSDESEVSLSSIIMDPSCGQTRESLRASLVIAMRDATRSFGELASRRRQVAADEFPRFAGRQPTRIRDDAIPDVDTLAMDDLCKVCMNAPIECAILDCGHFVTCMSCGDRLHRCPICRQHVIRVMRIYKS